LSKLEGPFYLFLAFTLAGTSVVSARIVSGALGTFVITAASLFFALLFLLPLCRKQLRGAIRGTTLRGFLFLIMQALFGIFLFRMCFINGLLYTSAGEAGVLTGATPALTALLAMTILKEPPGIRELAGVLSTVGGILLIQGFFTGGSPSMTHLAGNLLVLGAAGCEAVFNILSRISIVGRKTDADNTLNPLVQTTFVTAIAFLFCLIPALLDPSFANLSALLVREWFALIWYGVVVTAAAFVCWYAGIKRCGAFTAAAFSGMMPFTALLLSVLILGERSRWQQWAGGVLVIVGMAVIGSGNTPAFIKKTLIKKRQK
jgi:drug/metabolite transporter (DMT)-like permease